MKQYNYVQEAWEQRFQISRQRGTAGRFALGFAIGAAVTGALFFYATSVAIL